MSILTGLHENASATQYSNDLLQDQGGNLVKGKLESKLPGSFALGALGLNIKDNWKLYLLSRLHYGSIPI